MRRLLIDTDIFIDFLRGNAEAVKFFGKLWSCGDIIFSSVIIEAELLSGKSCERLDVGQKTETLINTINKINVCPDIAKRQESTEGNTGEFTGCIDCSDR
ncbi:MAG: hypothetical protein BME93_03855 [Methanosarcinales archaeon Met12]|nr:MAG: hypothetical protein BME93_03855 [Methanosarcinales archaeon Met12]